MVHISSAASALAAALIIGKRKGHGLEVMPPHNLPLTILGVGLLWFGFNAGSALSSGELSTHAFVTTHVAAASGAFVWTFVEWCHRKKPTTLGIGSGAIAGLATITPAAGFVTPASALLIGAAAGVLCYLGILMKNRLGYDDSLDVVGIHGVGGTLGILATGLLASKAVNDAGNNGLFYGNPGLLGTQFLSAVVTWIYAFAVTLVILLVIKAFMGLRVAETEEERGLDLTQHSETGYNF